MIWLKTSSTRKRHASFYKVQRFRELMRRPDGITQSTLTKQLRELEYFKMKIVKR